MSKSDETEKLGAMMTWFAGIVTTIVSGVTIYWLTEGLNHRIKTNVEKHEQQVVEKETNQPPAPRNKLSTFEAFSAKYKSVIRNKTIFDITLNVREDGRATGYIDIDPTESSYTNSCGAGNLSGLVNRETNAVDLSFTSFDKDPECEWSHNYYVELDGTLTKDKQTLNVRFTSYDLSGQIYYQDSLVLQKY